MKFTKMHGLGNDYVYMDCTKNELKDPEKVAVYVSDRHMGVGSDGLILICNSDIADFRMDMYNADGSRGEMCGNGIRCVGKYVYEYGLTDKNDVTIETLAGIKELKLTVENEKVVSVRVNMGAPELVPEKIPVNESGDDVINRPIDVNGIEYYMTCVSMGNPHCIIFQNDDVKSIDLNSIGPLFENHKKFPNRINTEFVQIKDEHTANMRVWERGSGETMACGTGACAVAVSGILNNLLVSPVTVKLLGGDLLIEWDGKGKDVYMTGPATVVFDGELKNIDL